jgi:hypothetical protein
VLAKRITPPEVEELSAGDTKALEPAGGLDRLVVDGFRLLAQWPHVLNNMRLHLLAGFQPPALAGAAGRSADAFVYRSRMATATCLVDVHNLRRRHSSPVAPLSAGVRDGTYVSSL